MPSDTEIVARMVELAIVRHGVAESDLEGTLDDANEIIAALTPTDTDTAIPAGWKLVPIDATEAMMKAGAEQGYWGDNANDPEIEARDVWRDMLAASPKPDTDTPVDPGVEGVREVLFNAFRAVWFNGRGTVGSYDSEDVEAFWNHHVELVLAAKPIAGMDAGEVEERVARIIAPNCNWSRGVKFDALYAPGRELALTKAKAILAVLATNQEDAKPHHGD